jgi:hypothetical protein
VNIEGPTEVDVQICFGGSVVFLECKYRSGISPRTTLDPKRNQLARLLDVVYEYAVTSEFFPRKPYVLLLGTSKNEPGQLTAYRDKKQLLTALKHQCRFPDHERMADLLSHRVGYSSWPRLADMVTDGIRRARRMEQGLLQDVVMYIRHKVSTAGVPGGTHLQLEFPAQGCRDGTRGAADQREESWRLSW